MARADRAPKGGLYDTIDQVVTDGVTRGLGHLSTEDATLDGRVVHVKGKEYLNFGTASYMALEKHPALVAGARDALERYGTQFSSSRTYLQLGLYEELEANLQRIFGRPALAAASTTLGHLSALPVLIHDDDVVILDQQVHSSIQVVTQILKARGVPLVLVRHNRMDQLEDRIRQLRNKHRRIWYMADGVYSMFGNGAPVEELHALMDRYPQLRVYIDDAHGFGWDGPHGCGYVRARIPHHPQMTLAVSMNKSYASAGGALVFGNDEDKQRIRNCGPTFIFCGPIQPPMLGACLAATRLHLSDALPPMQADLKERVRYCGEGLAKRGLPEVMPSATPLYFIPTGLPRVVYEVAQRLFDDGICVNIGLFPAVPMSQGGIRFHMHRGLAFEDIDRLLDRLEVHWKTVLTEQGVTPELLARAFRQREFAELDLAPPQPVRTDDGPPPLAVHHTTDLAEVDPAAWDACFAGRGPMDHAALATLAPAFAAAEGPGGAQAHYVRFTDDDGRTVLATTFCVTRMKEDMFSPADVSAKVDTRP